MSAEASSRKLHDAMRTLSLRWEQAREHWDDAVARRFHEDYLEEADDAVRAAMSAMNRISDVMRRARSECARDDS